MWLSTVASAIVSDMSEIPGSSTTSRATVCLVVFAGPTGGHIFPAQSFCEGFRNRFQDAEIHLITCHRAKALVEATAQGTYASVSDLPEFGFPGGFSRS